MTHIPDEKLQHLLIQSMRERLNIEEKIRVTTSRHDYPPEYHDEIIGKMQKKPRTRQLCNF